MNQGAYYYRVVKGFFLVPAKSKSPNELFSVQPVKMQSQLIHFLFNLSLYAEPACSGGCLTLPNGGASSLPALCCKAKTVFKDCRSQTFPLLSELPDNTQLSVGGTQNPYLETF